MCRPRAPAPPGSPRRPRRAPLGPPRSRPGPRPGPWAACGTPWWRGRGPAKGWTCHCCQPGGGFHTRREEHQAGQPHAAGTRMGWRAHSLHTVGTAFPEAVTLEDVGDHRPLQTASCKVAGSPLHGPATSQGRLCPEVPLWTHSSPTPRHHHLCLGPWDPQPNRGPGSAARSWVQGLGCPGRVPAGG